jgi:DNA mismatch repair ATPase MutL
MEGVPGVIERLPPHLQARVRGQHVVSSLAEALAECVGNSLDAGASEINVELDLAALGFRVQDNGSGVAAPRLALLAQQLQMQRAVGSAGRLPGGASSSSGGRPARLGYRGEALAAICATAATVELTSRAAGSFETHCLVLRRGSASASGSSGGLAAQLALEQRRRQGSVVSVRDMFCNQPVRRKALLAAGWVL